MMTSVIRLVVLLMLLGALQAASWKALEALTGAGSAIREGITG